jgi:hypothetical protein
MTIKSVAVSAEKDRTLTALSDCKINSTGCSRCKWDHHDLSTFPQDGECAVSAFKAKYFDVCTSRFRHSQTIQRKQ